MAVSVSDEFDPVAPADRIENLMKRLTQPISMIGVLGMLIAAGATVIDVLLRWLLNSGVAALNEIIAIAFSVAVAACIPTGMARDVAIRVELLDPLMTRKVVAWLKAVGAALLLLFLVILAWRIGVYASYLSAEGRTTIILGLRLAPAIWATTLLLAVAALVQAAMTWATVVRALATKSDGRLTLTSVGAIAFVVLLSVATIYGIFDFQSLSSLAQVHPALTILVALGILWLGLLALFPLTAVMGLLGIVGGALFAGFAPALSASATEAVGFLTSYQVASLPLFLLMGSLAAVSGIASDLYRVAQAGLGRFRGGVAMATIGGCAGFGTVTGASLATVITFGRVGLPQMEARRYETGFAAGCVAAGGTLGALIPPSSILIIFALLTEASIGRLFVAAIIPGILATLLYFLTITVVVRIRPSVAPEADRSEPGELFAALRNCGAVVILFGSVIGGMYSGVFTATEAAAVGAFIAFLIALFRGKFRREDFWSVMSETTTSTALIYTLMFSVLAFSFSVGLSGLPDMATAFAASLDLRPFAVIAIIALIFLVLGCVMDSLTIMVISVPILTPVVLSLGYDLVWWGIFNLIIVEFGMITPPFGLHLFVLKSLRPQTPLTKIYAGVFPFCVADSVRIILILLFPILALWLPSQMAN